MKELKLVIPIEKNYGLTNTDLIDGELDSFLIYSNAPMEILVESEFGYKIYSCADHNFGVYYTPIRVQAVDQEGHRIGFSSEKFKLNERLIIQVRTYLTSDDTNEVKIIIRYD